MRSAPCLWLALAWLASAGVHTGGCGRSSSSPGQSGEADKAGQAGQPAPQGASQPSPVQDEPGADSDQPAGASTGPAQRDTRDQYQLAAQISEAERMRRGERDQRFDDIRRDWLGKRYRWSVYLHPALCAAPEHCNVAPFDRGSKDRAIMQGWMPELQLSQETFAALRARCTGQERCPISFEGTLSRFTLNTEHFPSLHFSDVALIP